mmetsp:Transcript_30818/g.65125  ORF Transcript_30818/g.65125 Transcript_30818/m.65125 type:complete len:203 (-) Transcript_30818:42-650(-)
MHCRIITLRQGPWRMRRMCRIRARMGRRLRWRRCCRCMLAGVGGGLRKRFMGLVRAKRACLRERRRWIRPNEGVSATPKRQHAVRPANINTPTKNSFRNSSPASVSTIPTKSESYARSFKWPVPQARSSLHPTIKKNGWMRPLMVKSIGLVPSFFRRCRRMWRALLKAMRMVMRRRRGRDLGRDSLAVFTGYDRSTIIDDGH